MSYLQVVHCPNCGAAAELKNPAIVQVCCSYCESIYIWDKDSAKDIGKKSKLMPAISGLKIGVEGKLKDHSFRVIGRVQYCYQHGKEGRIGGKWDEWYLELDNDHEKNAWLSEDMGQLIWEQPATSTQEINKNSLQAGKSIRIDDKDFLVMESGLARCNGVEGILPFQVIPDETYPFADATSFDGSDFLTLEFDELREANSFIGKRLQESEITYSKEEITEHKKSAEALNCPNCGSPLSPLGDTENILTTVCSSCHSSIALDTDTNRILGKVKPELAKAFHLNIGDSGTLQGTEWMVTGRLMQNWIGERGYDLDYLLYNSEKGYLWLSQSNGHYTLTRPTDQFPQNSFRGTRRRVLQTVGQRTYRKFENGTVELTYVDGALPWDARIGDRVQYADAIAPPYLFTEERNIEVVGNNKKFVTEIEFYESEYINKEEIEQAFGKQLPPSIGIGAAQPYPEIPYSRLFSLASLGIFIFLVIFYFITGIIESNQRSSIRKKFYQPEKKLLQQNFKVKELKGNCDLKITEAQSSAQLQLEVDTFKNKYASGQAGCGILISNYGIEWKIHGYNNKQKWQEIKIELTDKLILELLKPYQQRDKNKIRKLSESKLAITPGKEIFSKAFLVSKKKNDDSPDPEIKITLTPSTKDKWLSVGIALVDVSAEKIIADKQINLAYTKYSGSYRRDGDREYFYWKLKKPGEYKLLLSALGGDMPLKETLMLKVVSPNQSVSFDYQNNNFRGIAFLWLLVPLFFYLRKNLFEKARWEDD